MKGMVERFNNDFIETRRRALQRFLSKVSLHPVLSHSHHLEVFLTAQVSSHARNFIVNFGDLRIDAPSN